MNESMDLRRMTIEQLNKMLLDAQMQKPKERIEEKNQALDLVTPLTSVVGGGIGLAASGGNPMVGGLAASGAGALTELALMGKRREEQKRLQGSADRVSDERRDRTAFLAKIQQELARRQASSRAMADLQRNAANAANQFS